MSHFFACCASQKTRAILACPVFFETRAILACPVFSDSRNVQKGATKSDTSGHCLAGPGQIGPAAGGAAHWQAAKAA